MDKLMIIRIVFWTLIFASCVVFGISVARYLKKYQIFQIIYARIRGRMAEVDRLRRIQMKTLYENNTGILTSGDEKKIPLLSKIYHKIAMSGISEKIPGMSELAMLITAVVITLVIFGVIAYFKGVLVGAIVAAVFVAIMYYMLSILAYRRRVSVEGQLLDLVNLVVLTSRQYSNLVDIFGTICDNFKGPLRTALEACYVEARATNHAKTAFRHLKDKFDSVQFAFVIDNLVLCSEDNGDFFGVASDLSKTVAIYIESFDKKQALLRNSKITLTIMALISAGIFYGLSVFLGEGIGSLFEKPSGIITSSLMILLYFYAMNMKAE